MKFALSDTPGYQIHSYAPGRLQIGERSFNHSILLTVGQITPWNVETVRDLTADHFSALLSFRPELVLLGTGERQVFPPRAAYRCLVDAQVGVEIMTTDAAARTFNVLAAEGRHVVAALIV